MALNDAAVFTAARGYIYTAAVDTAGPTAVEVDGFLSATGLGAGWNNIGHTSREDLPEFGFEGGEFEARGTWQNEVLKEVQTEALADYVTFNLHQFDDEGLSLYYGVSNAADSDEPGIFRVTDTGTTTTDRALCIVVVDGPNKIAFYAPKVGIRREDAIAMAVDEFATLPLRATFVKSSTAPNSALYEWISSDMGINPAGGS
jgi:hypothetical protein